MLLAVLGSAHADVADSAASALKSQAVDATVFGGSTTTAGRPQSTDSAKTTSNQSTTLNCYNGQAQQGAAPYGYITECTPGSAGKVTLNICSPDGNPADCTTATMPTDGTTGNAILGGEPITYAVSACQDFPQAGVGERCSLAFSVTHTYSGNGGSLGSDGQMAMSSDAANPHSTWSMVDAGGVVDQQGNVIQQGTSPAQTAASAQWTSSNSGSVASCFGRQKAEISNGQTVYTCDGTQSVKFDTGSGCTPDTVCTAWDNTTVNYANTCNQPQTFTNRTCDVVTNPVLQLVPGCHQGELTTGASVKVDTTFGSGSLSSIERNTWITSTCPDAGSARTFTIHATSNTSTQTVTTESHDISLGRGELVPAPSGQLIAAGNVYYLGGNSNKCRTISGTFAPLPFSGWMSSSQNTSLNSYAVGAGGGSQANIHPAAVLYAGTTCTVQADQSSLCTARWVVSPLSDSVTNNGYSRSQPAGPSFVNADDHCPGPVSNYPSWPLYSETTTAAATDGYELSSTGVVISITFTEAPHYGVTGNNVVDGCAGQ